MNKEVTGVLSDEVIYIEGRPYKKIIEIDEEERLEAVNTEYQD